MVIMKMNGRRRFNSENITDLVNEEIDFLRFCSIDFLKIYSRFKICICNLKVIVQKELRDFFPVIAIFWN